MELSFGKSALLLLLVAAVVAMLTRRLRLPYTVGLVAAGIVLTRLPFGPKISFTKELIFDALLPPLIFEAAIYLRWNLLRRELPVILTLASAGVVISAAVTAMGMHFLAHWQWSSALVFGSLIAATDPVSVIATFRGAGVHGRLTLLIEAESLFNDGTAAVAFGIAVLFTAGHALSATGLAMSLVVTVGGSLLCGAVVGGVAVFLTGRTEDHLVELTFTTVAAYGSFLLAEQLHFSGVLATIAAGLIIGNRGLIGFLSGHGRAAVQAFWEYAAFVANSLVFLLIGMYEATQNFRAFWLPTVLAVVVVLLGRAIAVYPICLLFTRSGLRVTARHQHVLLWGGLRGALALALALGLPVELPERAEIIAVSFGVVAFSVFVQGLTMPTLLRAIGELPPVPHNKEVRATPQGMH
ncbi:MAG: sodium:proton antiporter [Acidobacteriia bacterium]|nr:sodium:proton antiporter [Terriglobia bacterium]